jgi:DNA double-strand break repair protein
MGFRIKQVELNNFRSHEHFVFTPQVEGVTALRGRNGSGKTSIVSAVAWALYGTKPPGVSKNLDLRRKDAQKDDRTSVTVTLLIGDDTYTITRRMKNTGATEADIWVLTGDDEQKHIAGPAARDATEHVQRLLGMDEAGFETAVYFAQKQGDAFVASKPNERRVIVEKITGISGVSLALDENKASLREVNAQIRGMSVNKTTLGEKKTKYAALEKRLTAGNQKLAALEQRLTTVNTLLNDLFTEHTTKSKTYNTRVALEGQLATATQESATLDTTIQDLEARRTDVQEKIKKLGNTGNHEAIAHKYNQLTRNLTSAASALEATNQQISALEQEKTVLEPSAQGHTLPQVEEQQQAIQQQLNGTQEELQKEQHTLHTHQVTIDTTQQAYDSIAGLGQTCPTCRQEVANKRTVLESLAAQKQHTENEATKSTENITKLQEEVKDLTAQHETLENLKNSIQRLEEVNAQLQNHYKKHGEQTETLKNSQLEYDTYRDIYADSKNTADLKTEAHRISHQYQAALENKITLDDKISGLRKQLRDMPTVTQEGLDALAARIDKGRGMSADLTNRVREGSNVMAGLQETMAAARNDIQRDEENLEKYENLLKLQETLNHSLTTLAAFRQKVVDESVPVMEAYASSLLGRFTSGKFMKVNISSDFAITVTRDDGTTVNVALLSGGELSAVSMALAIAVSMMLAHTGGLNTIIFDEAFVSQDSVRVDSILSTIKDVCDGGQVILIAHNDNIEAIVDNIVTLDSDDV